MLSYLHMRNAFGDEDEVSVLPCRRIVYGTPKTTKQQLRACAAHSRVHYAIRVGALVPQPCEICAARDAITHHQDYSRPLDVNWLCWVCHRYVHLVVRELILIAE